MIGSYPEMVGYASVGMGSLHHSGIVHHSPVDINTLKKTKDDILKSMSLISKSGGDIEEQIHELLSLPYELDIRDYTKAIQSCRNIRHLSMLMNELRSRGLVPDLLFYNVYLKKCEDFREKEEAFHTYRQLLADHIHPDRHTIIVLIRCCLQAGSVFEAERVLNDAFSLHIEVNSYMYNLLIDFYARRAEPSEAFRLRAQMAGHNIRPDEYTVSSLMAACCPTLPSQSDLLSLLEDVRSAPLPARPVCVSALFSGIAKAPHLENHQKLRVIGLFFEALRARGFVLGQPAYTSLMTCCAKVGALAQARAYLRDMEKTGVEPNQYILTAFLSTCSKAKDYETALQVFNYMRSNERSCRPNKYTYEAMLVAAGNAGQLADAFQIYSDMLEEGIAPDTSTFARLLIVCGLCGDLTRGLQLQAEFTRRGLPRTSFYYHALIDLYSRCHQLGPALAVLDEMRRSGAVEASRYHYEPIVRLLVEERQWDQIDALLAAWTDISPSTLQFLLVSSYRQALWPRVLRYDALMRAHGVRTPAALAALADQARNALHEETAGSTVSPVSTVSPMTPVTPVTPISPATPRTPRGEGGNGLQFLEGKVQSIPEFVPMQLRRTTRPMFLESASLFYPSVASWKANSVAEEVLFGAEPTMNLDDVEMNFSNFDLLSEFDNTMY